jgi:hypothetical protein
LSEYHYRWREFRHDAQPVDPVTSERLDRRVDKHTGLSPTEELFVDDAVDARFSLRGRHVAAA